MEIGRVIRLAWRGREAVEGRELGAERVASEEREATDLGATFGLVLEFEFGFDWETEEVEDESKLGIGADGGTID